MSRSSHSKERFGKASYANRPSTTKNQIREEYEDELMNLRSHNNWSQNAMRVGEALIGTDDLHQSDKTYSKRLDLPIKSSSRNAAAESHGLLVKAARA